MYYFVFVYSFVSKDEEEKVEEQKVEEKKVEDKKVEEKKVEEKKAEEKKIEEKTKPTEKPKEKEPKAKVRDCSVFCNVNICQTHFYSSVPTCIFSTINYQSTTLPDTFILLTPTTYTRNTH